MIALTGDLQGRYIEIEARQFLAQCFALGGDKEPMQLLFKSIEVCDGTVRFQTRRRRHGHLQTVALGSRTFEIAAGQSGLIQVKLAHAARRLIARSGVLKIAVTTRSGQSTSRTFDV